MLLLNCKIPVPASNNCLELLHKSPLSCGVNSHTRLTSHALIRSHAYIHRHSNPSSNTIFNHLNPPRLILSQSLLLLLSRAYYLLSAWRSKLPKWKENVLNVSALCPTAQKEYVVHLPRHLRDFHKWSKEKAAQTISQFNLSKPRKRKIAERSRKHKRRVCPVRGCNAVVKRIHNHLRGKPKLTPDDTRYHDYLKETLFHELPETFQEDITSLIWIKS